MASGISLGPRDIVKPSSQPSVALYLQFYWKPVKKRITSENYFGNKTKNKKTKTNIFPQIVRFSVGFKSYMAKILEKHMLNLLKMPKETERRIKGNQKGTSLQEATCLFSCVSS